MGREAPVKGYIALYKVLPGGDVFVSNLFHQSQDYARLV